MTIAKGALVVALAAALGGRVLADDVGGERRPARTRPVVEPRLGFWEVRDVQMRLARLGYPVGEVDGTLGPRTRAAIRRFQRERDFAPHGRLDRQTLAALDVLTGPATAGAPQ